MKTKAMFINHVTAKRWFRILICIILLQSMFTQYIDYAPFLYANPYQIKRLSHVNRYSQVSVHAYFGEREITNLPVKIYDTRNGKVVFDGVTGQLSPKLFLYNVIYQAIIYDDGTLPYKPVNKLINFETNQFSIDLSFELTLKSHITQYNFDAADKLNIEAVQLAVPLLMQLPELPTGCEAVALTATLKYLGCDLDKFLLADQYMPKQDFKWLNGRRYGPDPQVAFAGNPRSSAGWFVYEQPMIKAVNAYLSDMNYSDLVAKKLDVSTDANIIAELAAGRPITIWLTKYLGLTNYSSYWYILGTNNRISVPTNLHCVVVYGYDADSFYIMDPLSGYRQYGRTRVMNAFKSLGSRAISVSRRQ